MSQILRKSDESNRLAFQKNAHTHIKKKTLHAGSGDSKVQHSP